MVVWNLWIQFGEKIYCLSDYGYTSGLSRKCFFGVVRSRRQPGAIGSQLTPDEIRCREIHAVACPLGPES